MKEKHLFICHDSEDDEHIQKLKELVAKGGYEIKNSSIDSTKPNDASNEEYVKSILRPRIEWSSCVMVLIGENTHQSNWVDWEIEYANTKGKSIVGVYVHGASDADVPESFEKYGDALVTWQEKDIIDAIEGRCRSYQNPDGTDRDSRHEDSFKRGDC